MSIFNLRLRALVTTAVLSTALCVSAFATGGETGNGDDVVLLPNGGVRVVDAYSRTQPAIQPRPTDERMKLSSALRSELAKVAHLLVRYRAASSNSGKIWETSDFVDQYILSDDAKFYLTDDLPCRDAESAQQIGVGDAVTAASAGTKQVPVACTDGENTWIVKSLLPQLPLRDQAILITHERMHALPESPSHLRIFGVTRGLYVALGLLNQQAAGERPKLSEDQFEALTGMLHALAMLNGGKTIYAQTGARIAPNGGGVVLLTAETEIAADSYLGVGSILEYGTVGHGAELINSACMGCQLADNAVLKNVFAGVDSSELTYYCLDKNYQPDPKHDYCRMPLARFAFGEGFSATDSYLTRSLHTGYDKEALVSIPFGAQARVTSTKITGIPLGSSFGPGSVLDSITINEHHRLRGSTSHRLQWENADAAPKLIFGSNSIVENATDKLILAGFDGNPVRLGARPALLVPAGTVMDFGGTQICPHESFPGMPFYDGGYARVFGIQKAGSSREFRQKYCEQGRRGD